MTAPPFLWVSAPCYNSIVYILAVLIPALASAAQVSKSSPFTLKDSIQLLNHLGHGEHCTHSHGPKISAEAAESYRKLKAFCDALDGPKTDPDYGPCAATWENGKPPWIGDPRIETHAKEGVVPPTRAQALKQGIRAGNQLAVKNLLSVAAKIRDEMAPECCRGNEECTLAVKAVKIEACPMQQSQNKPDPCLAGPGQYQIAKEERMRGLERIFKGVSAPERRKLLESRDLEKWKRALDLSDAREVRITEPPTLGKIILPTYFLGGEPIANVNIVRHEIGHACSHVLSQLHASLPGANRLAALARLSLYDFGNCEADEPFLSSYETMLKEFEDGPAIFRCLMESVKEASNRESAYFVKGVCPAKKVEETVADALSLLSNKNAIAMDSVPFPACDIYPSTTHHPTNATLACLYSSSPAFRKRLRADICGGTDSP